MATTVLRLCVTSKVRFSWDHMEKVGDWGVRIDNATHYMNFIYISFLCTLPLRKC